MARASGGQPFGVHDDAADWNRWRGSVDTQLKAIPAALDEATRTLAAQIDALERNLNRRLDAQDKEIGGIHEQTRATNGTVIRHTSEITSVTRDLEDLVEAAESSARRAADAATTNANQQAGARRFRLQTVIGAAAAAAALAGAIGELLAILHL